MNIEAMTVADLKRELKARNLLLKGTKAELIQRLQEALAESGANNSSDLSLGEGELPHDEEGLLEDDDDEPLEDSKVTPAEVAPQPTMPKAAAAPPVNTVKTASALQKEGVLQSMEDDLFSDTPPAPVLEPRNKNQPIAAAPEVSAEKMKARAARFGIAEEQSTQETPAAAKKGKNIGETPVVDKQKLLDRAKRFGLSVGDDGKAVKEAPKKTIAANKATTPAAAVLTTMTAADLEKLKKRAERFGGNVSTIAEKADEADKILKRKAKFEGNQAAAPLEQKTLTTSDDDTVKKPVDIAAVGDTGSKRKRIEF